MRTRMRLGLIAAMCIALGCGGASKKVWAGSAADEQKQTTQTETKTENNGPTMWKVEGDTVMTASGLQYLMVKEGTGDTPKTGDRVSVHYSGWLLDGSKFDSSVDRGEPYSFTLGRKQVIAGWDEGVALMKKGEKRQFIIPSDLAYGDRGHPAGIPPKATLIFDVELLDIGPAQ